MTAMSPTTITERLPIICPCVITANDGFGNAVPVSMLVMIDSRAMSTAEPGDLLRADALRAWVQTYLTGKDLSRVLDFEPTPRNLALYLSRVFRGIDPDIATVHVGLDGGLTYRVDYED